VLNKACLTRDTFRMHPGSKANSTAVASSSSADTSSFDVQAYDAERLRLDEQARSQMKQQASSMPSTGPGAWKWQYRKSMWDRMEAEDIARFPRPVHHRIPNFVGADAAALKLASLPEFQRAQCMKVNPDTPQKPVRYHVLSSGKTLLTPQPRLRTGFFSTLQFREEDKAKIGQATSSAGVAQYGVPVNLDSKIKVDLIVVGSSVVDQNGCRLGKGEGFAELEYGILRFMSSIDEKTLVVTTVHDCQVLPERDIIDPSLMLEHDVPVDLIVTPTRVIPTNTSIRKPPGILWHKLSPQKLAQIRILQELKARIEREQGISLPSGPEEVLPPLAERKHQGSARGRSGGRGRGGGGRGRGHNRNSNKRSDRQQSES